MTSSSSATSLTLTMTSQATLRHVVSVRTVLRIIAFTGLLCFTMYPSFATGREASSRRRRLSNASRTTSRRGGARARRRWAEGDIRLIGGPNKAAGIVYMYHNGKWGAVCDDVWNVSNSDVVCRQRGFPGTARLAEKKEFGGKAKRRIWITNVQCEGHEKRLLDCSYLGWGFRIRHMCPGEWRAAGVVCKPKPRRKKKKKRTPAERGALRLRNWRKYLARLKARAEVKRREKAAAEARKKKLMMEKEKKKKKRKPTLAPRISTEPGEPTESSGTRINTGKERRQNVIPKSNDLSDSFPDGNVYRESGGSSEQSNVLIPWALREGPVRGEQDERQRRPGHHSQNPVERKTKLTTSTKLTTQRPQSTTKATNPTTTTTTAPSTTTTPTTTTTTSTTSTPTTTASTTTTTATDLPTTSTATSMPSTVTTTMPSTTATIPSTSTTDDLDSTTTASSASTSSPTKKTLPSELATTGGEESTTGAAKSGELTTILPVDLSKAKASGEIILKDKEGMAGSAEDALLLQADSPRNPDLELKLTGGRYTWEGLLMIREKEKTSGTGPWGTICGDLWGMKETMVVCRQLGLNYAKQPLKTKYFKGHDDEAKAYYAFNCTGREAKLSECPAVKMSDKVTCSKKTSVAGVVCATFLPDLIPNLRALSDSVRLQDRPLYYLQCALEENCLSSSAYHIRNTTRSWRNKVRRLLRFSTIVHNRGDADFRPYVAKGQWEWHACHQHFHSMEIFAHYDIMDKNGTRLAEGSKASFCLEDTTCDRGVRRQFQCVGYGDQGLSVNCSDDYTWDIDCQWIDITDIEPGTYTFLMEINPTLMVAESDFDNNVARCDLWYSGYFARLVNCRHESLLDYRG